MMISYFNVADALLTSLINEGAGFHPAIDTFMVAVGVGAVPVMVMAVAIQWWLGEDREARRYAAIAAGLSFMVGLSLNQLLLLFVNRPRPYDALVSHLLISPTADPSFPSDHATAAFAIAFSYIFLGWSRVGPTFLTLAILVALSRVYVGAHYVGDVMGGMATALIAVIATQMAYRPHTAINRRLTSFL